MFRPLGLALAGLVLVACGEQEAAMTPKLVSAPAAPESSGGLPAPPALPAPAKPATLETELLPRLNDLRADRGLAPLVWSAKLAAASSQLGSDIIKSGCTHSSTRRTLGPLLATATYKWIGGIPSVNGANHLQDASAAYIVSEWAQGADEYDAVANTCWSGRYCELYRPIVAPAATAVGCVRIQCPSQDQVWICRFDQDAPKLD